MDPSDILIALLRGMFDLTANLMQLLVHLFGPVLSVVVWLAFFVFAARGFLWWCRLLLNVAPSRRELHRAKTIASGPPSGMSWEAWLIQQLQTLADRSFIAEVEARAAHEWFTENGLRPEDIGLAPEIQDVEARMEPPRYVKGGGVGFHVSDSGSVVHGGKREDNPRVRATYPPSRFVQVKQSDDRWVPIEVLTFNSRLDQGYFVREGHSIIGTIMVRAGATVIRNEDIT